MLHNETVNIWSHFIGLVAFIFMIGYLFVYMAPSNYDVDRSLIERWSVATTNGEMSPCQNVTNFLQSEKLLSWTDSKEGSQQATWKHAWLNKHSTHFETLENWISSRVALFRATNSMCH